MDLELSETGRDQAECAANLLATESLTHIYSSPLIRARQTAEIIASPHDLEIGLIKDIEEIDVGEWEGRAWVEIAETDPEAYNNFMADSANHGYLGGESMGQLTKRCVPVLTELMHQHVGSTIAVVAHNAVNRVFTASLLGLPPSQAREIQQDNCCVNVIQFRHDSLKLLTLNTTFHLR